jgi:NitT/TauT family transport system substrate-binding protein
MLFSPHYFDESYAMPIFRLVLKPIIATTFFLLFLFPLSLIAQEKALPEKVTIYTATGATTAVLPLLAAILDGWPGTELEIIEWKNLDDLRGLVLAGKGDIWVGHLETLALAAGRGAPVSVAAITAWKKFYFLSAPLPLDPGAPPRYPKDLLELSQYLQKEKLSLSAAPRSSPAAGIVVAIAKQGGPAFNLSSLPPQQVLLELSSNKIKAALLPEPMVTVALSKNADLKIIANLEDEYAKLTGGDARLPQAGIAVNTEFVKKYPSCVYQMVSAMLKGTDALKVKTTAEIVAILPESTKRNLGAQNLQNSLSRDIILTLPAWEVKSEIENFLCVVAHEELCQAGHLKGDFPTDFVLPESSK